MVVAFKGSTPEAERRAQTDHAVCVPAIL